MEYDIKTVISHSTLLMTPSPGGAADVAMGEAAAAAAAAAAGAAAGAAGF